MHDFTPWSALLGGASIGLGATVLLVANGRIAGVSGIMAGLLPPRRGDLAWRAAFLIGLLIAGGVAAGLAPERLGSSPRGVPWLVLAGLLVGVGTRLGGGCTSGHGVCGISRLSIRSIVATALFVATGMAVASALRGVGVGV